MNDYPNETDAKGTPPLGDAVPEQAPPAQPSAPPGQQAWSEPGPTYEAATGAPGFGQGQRNPMPGPTSAPFEARRKSPGLASILSLAPGLGQVYLGYYTRGFTHLAVVAFTISILAEGDIPNFMYPLLGLFLPFFWLYNIIDAGRRAAYYNLVLEGGEADGLQPEFDMPQRGGSMAGGLALIIGGLYLLLHIQFDLSLQWLETWWPIIPVFIGIYLFMKGLRERSESP